MKLSDSLATYIIKVVMETVQNRFCVYFVKIKPLKCLHL